MTRDNLPDCYIANALESDSAWKLRPTPMIFMTHYLRKTILTFGNVGNLNLNPILNAQDPEGFGKNRRKLSE